MSSKEIERKPIIIERGTGAGIHRQSATIRRGKLPSPDVIFDPDETDIEESDGDLLDQLDAETKAVVDSVRRDRKAYADFMKAFNDNKFYCCLVFQSEAQKIDFLQKAGLLDTIRMHNYDNMFLNGLEVARRLGHDVEPVELLDYNWRGNPSKYRKEVIPNVAEKDDPL